MEPEIYKKFQQIKADYCQGCFYDSLLPQNHICLLINYDLKCMRKALADLVSNNTISLNYANN